MEPLKPVIHSAAFIQRTYFFNKIRFFYFEFIKDGNRKFYHGSAIGGYYMTTGYQILFPVHSMNFSAYHYF